MHFTQILDFIYYFCIGCMFAFSLDLFIERFYRNKRDAKEHIKRFEEYRDYRRYIELKEKFESEDNLNGNS